MIGKLESTQSMHNKTNTNTAPPQSMEAYQPTDQQVRTEPPP